MNIVLLQAASGPDINGPVVRVPPGNYDIERSGVFESCLMFLNKASIPLNGQVLLSNHTSVKLQAKNAKDLTVKFVRTI